MSFLSSIGGLAAGFNGAVSAVERMGQQNLAAEDAKFVREQRDRKRQEWGKSDKLEDELIEAAKNPQEVPEQAAAPGTPEATVGAPVGATGREVASVVIPDATQTAKSSASKFSGFGIAPADSAPGAVSTSRVSDLARRQSDVYARHGKVGDAIRLLSDASTFERGNLDAQDRLDARTYQRGVGQIIEEGGGLSNPNALDAAAKFALKNGQTEQWMKMTGQAHTMRWNQSAAQLAQLEAGYKSGSISPQAAADAVREIYNNDIGAGNVESVQVDPSGRISLVAVNGITGQRVNKSFSSPAEMFKSLGDFYRSPEMRASIIEQSQKMQFWRAQEDYKHANNREIAEIRWGGDGSRPASSGAGNGGKPSADRSSMSAADIAKEDLKALYDKAASIDGNKTIGGAARIAATIDQLAEWNPSLGSSDLLDMATQMQSGDLEKNLGKQSSVSLDPATGSIVRAIPGGGGKSVTVGRLSFDQLDKAGREQLTSSIRAQAGEVGITPQQLRNAAQGPEQAKQLLTMVREQAKFRMLDGAQAAEASTGREVPMAQIDQHLDLGMKRIEALLGVASQIYANQ